MDKFLQKPSSIKASGTTKTKKKPGQQQRLCELQKVVKLNASKYTICQTELASLREALGEFKLFHRLFHTHQLVRPRTSVLYLEQLINLRNSCCAENPATTVQELGHCLRHLDSLILHSDALIVCLLDYFRIHLCYRTNDVCLLWCRKARLAVL